MRPLPVILALSIAANVGFAVVCIVAPRDSARQSRATQTNAQATSGIPKSDPARLAEALKTNDAKTIFDQLRALGFTDANAHDLARRFIWMKYYNRQREILAAKRSATGPYWRGPDQGTRNYTAEERKELRELANQANRETIAMLGSNVTDETAARYAFLPQEKIAQLRDLQRDYSEMVREIGEEASRFRLPSDSSNQRLLYEEFQNDLKSIFTPEELAAYEQRYSAAAINVRRSFAGIDATEAEYLAVYNVMKSVSDQYPVSSPRDRDAIAARAEALKQANGEIKMVLGDERYADYMRAQNSDYRSLQAAADRFQIPVETINNVYALRDVASKEYHRINTDTTLSAAEKKQARMDAAAKIRAQVCEQLGEEVGNAYLEKNMAVLKRMSTGSATGRNSSSRRR
ncbi:hypothetical protein M2103_000513 [Ereboglobus sp. PH5-5]|uniref:hypothetical protein n=1 Tax=Ereboglobus sp. PH5-5 TaxID=2940529 RepID=UPI002406AC92|nr:hypothetical protein [Ereboglobus sp. PH5-5]MDF9832303.1 hypothetical protein [Ereboglobus sp. PH5-5]